jgi:hypothetical protein
MSRARTAALLAAVALVLLALASPARAYPALWVKYQLEDDKLPLNAPSTCAGHPDHGEGGHGDPVPDADTTFTVTDGSNKAIEGPVCPGDDVSVSVLMPEERFLLVSSSNGTLKGKTPSTLPPKVPQAACQNRWVHGMAGGQTAPLKTARLTLKVPCSQVGDISVNVTSATGSTSPYLMSSTTVPVAAADAKECKPCVDKPPPRLPNPITGPKNATAANATDAAAANATAPATSAATSSSSAAAVVTVVAAAAAALVVVV